MATKLLSGLLFLLILVSEGWASYDVKVSDVFFDGGFLFFSVKRAKLQQRLDEINSQFGDNNFVLLMPSEPVLQDVIASDEHVIMVTFGTMEVVTPENGMTNSTTVEGLSIQIPYLTVDNDDSLDITFQVDTFISEVGPQIQADLIPLSATVADLFVLEETGNTTKIQIRNGDLQLSLFGEYMESRPLNEEDGNTHLKEYNKHVQTSLSGPTFSICDQSPDVTLCDIYKHPQYNPVLEEEGTNVCQYWEPIRDDIQRWDSTFQVVSISQAMRELLLLDEDQDVLQAELQSGTFSVKLVFPCNGANARFHLLPYQTFGISLVVACGLKFWWNMFV